MLVVGTIMAGFIVFTLVLLSVQKHHGDQTQPFLDQARRDGFTQLYDACALHPDGILRVRFAGENSVRDYPKANIRNVRIADSRVLVFTRNIEDPVIELKVGAKSSDLFTRLQAMVV